MLAARNRWFRIAATLSGSSVLVLAALEIIDLDHILQETVRGGYIIAAVLLAAGNLIGGFGWFTVGSGFEAEIDWGALRAGAVILATTYFAYFIAWMFRLVAVFAETRDVDYRSYYIAAGIGTLISAAGAFVIATAFGAGRGAESRVGRLWLGAILFAVAAAVTSVGVFYLRSFYSSAHAVDEAVNGTLLVGLGSLVGVAATLAFVAGVRRPLAARERALVVAGAISLVGTVGVAAGEALVALAYSRHGAADWQREAAWLAAASHLPAAAALVAAVLGARSAWRGSALGAAGAA